MPWCTSAKLILHMHDNRFRRERSKKNLKQSVAMNAHIVMALLLMSAVTTSAFTWLSSTAARPA
jgi:hypothetical protein